MWFEFVIIWHFFFFLHFVCCCCCFIPDGTDSDSSQTEIIESLNNTGEYVIGVCVTVAVLVVILGATLSRNHSSQTDGIQYLAIGKFFYQVGDLFTDIFFNVILILEDRLHALTYISLISLILSYFGSITICGIWIDRWNSWQHHYPQRLRDYLHENRTKLIILTTFSNFYVAVDLLRSKLLYKNVFYLPLTRNEHLMLDGYRFLNIVCLENLCQLIIQAIYLANSDISEVNSIVIISTLFSIFSIVIATLKCAMNMADHSNNENLNKNGQSAEMRAAGELGQKSVISGHFVLESRQLNQYHAFAHNKINFCLVQFINSQLDTQIAGTSLSRSDIVLLCDVYYIENKIVLEDKIGVYYIIEISHSDDVQLVNGVYNILSSLFAVKTKQGLSLVSGITISGGATLSSQNTQSTQNTQNTQNTGNTNTNKTENNGDGQLHKIENRQHSDDDSNDDHNERDVLRIGERSISLGKGGKARFLKMICRSLGINNENGNGIKFGIDERDNEIDVKKIDQNELNGENINVIQLVKTKTKSILHLASPRSRSQNENQEVSSVILGGEEEGNHDDQ